MLKNTKRQTKGITLIALVITIIVLLILAGVSISMLSGDNSILSKAGQARDITGEKSIAERVQLAYLAALANGKGNVERADLLSELQKEFGADKIKDGDISSDGLKVTIDGKDYNFDGTIEDGQGGGQQGGITTHTETLSNGVEVSVKIPEGFTKSTETGEKSVETGLVIKDNTEIQNEYVWIPVFEKSDKFTWGVDYSGVTAEGVTEGSDAYYTAIETALKSYTETYKSTSYTDVWYGDENNGQYGYYDGAKFVYYTNGNMTKDQYKTLYRKMLKSVYENGGFYIGRYEMGIEVVDTVDKAKAATRVKVKEYTPSNAKNTSTNNTAETSAVSIQGMTAPISKPNAVAYTRITQSQAEMLAESLNYTGVTSSLLFGVQWDAVCVYLEHFGKIDSNATASAGKSFDASYLNNNTNGNLWGNVKNATFKMDRGFYSTDYSNSTAVTWNVKSETAKGTSDKWLCTTGASDQNKACNIYDFAGNLTEWTLERYSDATYPCVPRGNYFDNSDYASNRYGNNTYYSNFNYSARSSLYISSTES